MTSHALTSNFLPRPGAAPGELLWGEAPKRQPIAPLVLMAVVLLLVAAPGAMAGGGGSNNPITILKEVATSTYELTGLMGQSNTSLKAIDTNSKRLIELQTNMAGISAATQGMAEKTDRLNTSLSVVGTAVASSNTKLAGVDAKLDDTAKGLGGIKKSVGGSLSSTQAVVAEFSKIDTAIGAMDSNLKLAITQMARSAPLTKEFANNKTRVEIAGGSSDRYGVANFAANNRVMSIMLPMIATMQTGGKLPARKDSHEASNFIVNTALKLQVPDGTNVVAIVRPYDPASPQYGLPGPDFFVQNRIHGF